MIRATPYSELNEVLEYLVEQLVSILDGNMVGAYLQGSFAVGDFGPYSDCDFIVVLAEDLSSSKIRPLQQLHERIQTLPIPYWPLNLEGSYAPEAVLRRWGTSPRDPPDEPRTDEWNDPGTSGTSPMVYPFWFLDHGAKTLVRSEHDNSQVVRWCLREKGIVLSGPEPGTLIDEVTAGDLRAEVVETLRTSIGTGLPMPMVAWQSFWVGLFCRILHTVRTGEVTSKRAAMHWACQTLEARWRYLIESAQSVKKGEAAASALPDPWLVDATRSFAAYCLEYANTGH